MEDKDINIKDFISFSEIQSNGWDLLDNLEDDQGLCIVRGIKHKSGVLISKAFYQELLSTWKSANRISAEPIPHKSKEELEFWLIGECLNRTLPNLKKDLNFYSTEEQKKIKKLQQEVKKRAKELGIL